MTTENDGPRHTEMTETSDRPDSIHTDLSGGARSGGHDVDERRYWRFIEAQKLEIEEMNWLLDDIETNGKATTEGEGKARPVPELTSTDYDG